MSTRLLVFASALATLLCAAFVALYSGFPHEPQRRYIFDYLLQTQDLPAAALLIGIAIAAAIPGLARAGLALVDWVGRNPATTVLVAFVGLCAGQLFITKDYPLAGDEPFAVLQSEFAVLEDGGVAHRGA